ncbi:hypothetical protein [Bacteroides sp.]|uniref:hypothetical protein n=1 Tax=Bacteroides sp. TaxID=29523 RepID=UPI00261E44C8|nr:hypothetical protein [Bacteroides sp.]MDD3040203.1 hypothetical protein [Bacteroides sp.]
MITPNIRYYARMEDCTGNGKTPKYVITAQASYFPPMENIVGRDGKVSMYLQVSKDSGSKKDNAPAMKLQAKDSLNFTGLKDYFVDGKLSGFAYGYPLAAKAYSSKQKSNPFYEYKDDGYLFIIHQDKNANTAPEQIRPTIIELIVLEGAKVLISSYCKQLMMGGFDEAIKSLRDQAK